MEASCPICSSSRTSHYARHNKIDQELYYCGDCDYYFVFPHAPIIRAEEVAGDQPENTAEIWGSDEAREFFDIWRAEENRKVIASLPRELDKVLEIGFGAGPLTEHLLPMSKEYWGIEPDRIAFDSTVERLSLESERVYLAKAEEMMQVPGLVREKGTFDTIVLISVFEHLSQPALVLQHCHALLKPGGALYITVPNSSNFRLFDRLRRLFHVDSWSIDHISFFTRKSILGLFERTGFDVERSHTIRLFSPKSARYFAVRFSSTLVLLAMYITWAVQLDRLLGITRHDFLLRKPSQ
jgi:SAM-dependent methyltransferase